jgi:hypothetical protein
MGQLIKLDQFLGEVSNADLEDVDSKNCVLIQNMIDRNGKLVKTYGFGDYFTGVVGATKTLSFTSGYVCKWTGAWAHPSFTASLGSGTGYCLLAYAVHPTTNVVEIKYWNGTTKAWVKLSSAGLLTNYASFGTYYHNSAKNPVIYHDEIFRFLPGNIKSTDISGTHEPKGIWLGYIDRDYFDGLYDAGGDYTAGFYGLDTKPIKVNPTALSLAASQGGSFVATSGPTIRKYYKFSDTYDGVQEGPLSDATGIDITDYGKATAPATITDGHGIMSGTFTVAQSSHNKRITARNLYRCDTADGEYKKIHIINFLRKAAETGITSQASGAVAGAYDGLRCVYIPGASTLNFNGGTIYYINVWEVSTGTLLHEKIIWAAKDVDPTLDAVPGASGTGYTWFVLDSEAMLSTQLWDCRWAITHGGIAGLYTSPGVTVDKENLYAGAFTGRNVTIINNAAYSTLDKYVGGVVAMGGTTALSGDHYGQVIARSGLAIKSEYQWLTSHLDSSFAFISLLDGLYFQTEAAGTFTYRFFDYDLTPGANADHPYPNEDSWTVNGQYAQVVNDILIQGNINKDPLTTDEYKEDEISYSLLSQLDATPVSRVMRIQDAEGGPVTGIAMSFNSCLIYKKRSKFRLLLNDPSDVTSWEFRESLFNRGNLATSGVIQIGHKVYSVANDGIYEDDISSIVSADDTALIATRVSEPINDAILTLTDAQKAAVISGYDSVNAEVVFKYGSVIRAFDITRKTWRTIGTSLSGITVMGSDHLNGLLVYDAPPGGSDMLYTTLQNESVLAWLRTKHFRLNTIRKEILNSLQIIYKSAVLLKVNMYFDGAFSTPIALTDLAISGGAGAEITTAKLRIKRRCKSAMLEIKEASASSSAVELHTVEIYTD